MFPHPCSVVERLAVLADASDLAFAAASGDVAGGAGDRFLLGAGVLSLLAEAAGPCRAVDEVLKSGWCEKSGSASVRV